MKYENVYSYEYTLDTSFNMFRYMNVFGFGKDIEMHAAHRITKTSYHILLCLLYTEKQMLASSFRYFTIASYLLRVLYEF